MRAVYAGRLECATRQTKRHDRRQQGQGTPTEATIALNKRARYEYFIEDKYEAGMALQGWEVKSLRAGKAQITEGYVLIKDGEAWLIGAHFSPLQDRLDAHRRGPDAHAQIAAAPDANSTDSSARSSARATRSCRSRCTGKRAR